ncbi:MAG: hypothetical protein AB1498_11785, partial [bacterium]
MSRIIITTCGTSLYKSSCWKWNSLNNIPISTLNSEPKRLRDRQFKCEEAIIQAQNSDKSGKILAETFDKSSWDDLGRLRDLPAELASLRVIQNFCEKNGKPLNNTDKLYLLYADNEEAQYCANILHKVLIDFNLLNNIVIETPWKIEDLDPKDIGRFQTSIKSFWEKLIKIMPDNSGNRYYLNLTGGYKSTVILSSAVLKSSFLFFKGLRVLPPQILHYILYKNRTIRDLYSQPC